jgi:carboxyl-terminal processing protease
MGESDIIYLRVFVPDFVRALLRVAVLRSIIEFLEARMSLKVRAVLVVVIGLVLGLSLSVGGGLIGNNKAPDKEELAWEQARLFAEVLERVKRDYVEPIDDAELLESAIRGMVSDLDAHSQYLDASEYRDIRISTTGSYTGIGIEIDDVGGNIMVITPIAGSPAARSGIRSGDEIVAVDGIAIDPGNLHDTIGRLRGSAGSKVMVSVRRADDIIEHEMRRQVIRMASVHGEFLGPSFGYVRVSQFSENTARELGRAVDDLQDASNGMLQGLVLDLRNNPGGVLDAAVDVTDLFLDSGVIVTADGRTIDSRFVRSAHRGDILDGAALVVIVNKGSASASEIVAGALQDHGRALVVGTETFGKGLVQTVVPLSRGRAIKLTTSRYYTPSGDSIHDVGVTPDIYVEDTPGFPDLSLSGLLDRESDAQLAEAIEHLHARPVMHSNAQ